MRTFALIPAAGLSLRMGTPKLMLPYAGRPILAHVLAVLQQSPLAATLVVTRPGAADLLTLVREAGAEALELTADTADMRATCIHGIEWLEASYRPALADGCLLCPADHPTLTREVVARVLRVAEAHDEALVVLPSHGGKRGHPTWLRWSLAQEIMRLDATQGINQLIRAHGEATVEIAWPSPEIHRDVDTPEDYARLSQDEPDSLEESG